MGLVRIKLLGRSFSSNAGDSLPGARPASSTTRRPYSGGRAGIICSTMYSSDCNVTKGEYWSGAGLGEALSLGLAEEGDKLKRQAGHRQAAILPSHPLVKVIPSWYLIICRSGPCFLRYSNYHDARGNCNHCESYAVVISFYDVSISKPYRLISLLWPPLPCYRSFDDSQSMGERRVLEWLTYAERGW